MSVTTELQTRNTQCLEYDAHMCEVWHMRTWHMICRFRKHGTWCVYKKQEDAGQFRLASFRMRDEQEEFGKQEHKPSGQTRRTCR